MKLLSRYSPSYLKALLYMLQASEYRLGDYLRWLHQTDDFRQVMKRGNLDKTAKIKLLALALWLLTLIILVIALALVVSGSWLILAGVVLLLIAPWLLAYALIVPLWLGQVLIQRPREQKIIAAARQRLAAHPAIRIAIAGSFGKTTAKEILATVLGEVKKVAATPGNMNTMIGTSRFIESLSGDEDVLIFELGESHVGDVAALCDLVRPDIGIITGINEAHLATFGSIDKTIATIFELGDYLGDKPLYKNLESDLVRQNIEAGDRLAYGQYGVNGWQVSDIKTSIQGTEFCAQKGAQTIWARSGLIGNHNIGILVAAIDLAASFGLSPTEIAEGIKKVQPFEHRMKPRQVHDAWVIDDTYNGNIEGVAAGLKLLKDLPGQRKVYVTPGLVEQGSATEAVHNKMGRLIAESADVVVLMQNSVTDYISAGLQAAGFKGRVMLIEEPLEFYTNLEHFVAAGDIVLMQNDWTDNYL